MVNLVDIVDYSSGLVLKYIMITWLEDYVNNCTLFQPVNPYGLDDSRLCEQWRAASFSGTHVYLFHLIWNFEL